MKVSTSVCLQTKVLKKLLIIIADASNVKSKIEKRLSDEFWDT